MRNQTEEKYKEICRLFWSGIKIDEIVEKVHCCRSTVDRAISLYGKIPKRDAFADHKEETVEMFDRGKTYQEIADETGLSLSTIRRNFAKMGLRRRRSRGMAETSQEQEEPEIIPLQYADNKKRAERVVIRGKAYLDVSAWYM